MIKQVLSYTKQCRLFAPNKSVVLKEATNGIRDDVVTMIQQAPILPWPPTVESMESQERQPSESLTLFGLREDKRAP